MFSNNLWVIKVNKKPKLLLPAVHCIYVIKSQLETLFSTYPILNYFAFHSMFPTVSWKQNINLTEVFYANPRVWIFHFYHTLAWKYSLQVFLVGFSNFLPFNDWRNPTILVYFHSNQYLSLEKPVDSHWFKMSCLTCLFFSCIYCFFLKRWSYIKIFVLHE